MFCINLNQFSHYYFIINHLKSKNDDIIDDIFDQDYNEKIMRNLNELLENTERLILEELEKTQNEMQKFLEELMEEKLEKTIEINKKYENELKELETDLDLSNTYF